jgi:mono/diheme cytochrome c family protein
MKKNIAHALVVTALLATTSAFAADAKENWDQHCAKCHSADGSGSTKMGKKLKVKDYTDAKVQAEFTDEQLAKVTLEGATKDGKELMKGYKEDLSPADVTALVAYIRQMKK